MLGLTISHRVLLQEIGHVYVGDAFLLVHQIVAVGHLSAAGTSCGATVQNN